MVKRLRLRHRALGRLFAFLALLLLALSASRGSLSAQSRPALALLDRYAAGEFQAVAEELQTLQDFGDVLKDLKSDDGQKWLDAAGPQDRNRRELAAATFALEAARADEWREWKWWVGGNPTPQPTLWWMAPPVLIEWGCRLLRQHKEPLPTERLWQLAAMSVAQRSEDTQFLIGFTQIEGLDSPPEPVRPAATPLPALPGLPGISVRQAPPNFFRDEVANPRDEIGHLNHVVERFPDEKRFLLGEAIARERPAPSDAFKAYFALANDASVGGEATVRFGALYLRRGDAPKAIQQFDQAERLTRDPDLLYLARYYRGQALLRLKKETDAIVAFRAALKARPASQSASTALAALLVKTEQITEAHVLMHALLDAGPDRTDPHIEYVHGDDRFWPIWIEELHAAISPKALGDAIQVTARPATVRSGAERGERGWGPASLKEDDAAETPSQQPQQQRPTFTANTDVVFVDVSVRKGGSQLTGLTAADFELRDNGVKQDIDTIESTAVPIDLSIVVDVSGNQDRPWVKLPPMSKVAADVDAEARRLTALLRPGDRARLLVQDTYVQQIWPLQSAASLPAVQRIVFDGQSSLYDTLTTLLLQPSETTRRHVIVAATRGADTISAVSAADLALIAGHADAQLHIVMEEKKADEEATVRVIQAMGNIRPPTYRFFRPALHRLFVAEPIMGPVAPLHLLLPDGVKVKEGAESTGGGLYQGEMMSEPSLHGVFTKAFENFRQSYVLRYTPKGVPRAGWHQIVVTVPREKSVVIRSRTGYNVDAGATATTPGTAAARGAAAPAKLATLSDLMTAYGDGRYADVDAALGQVADLPRLIKEFDFTQGLNPWPGTVRSEAAFALELAAHGLFSKAPASQEAARGLLERYSRLVQPSVGTDQFERAWLMTEVALLQGRIAPTWAEPLVARALARFPTEPHFLLAKAIVLDQRQRGFASQPSESGTVQTPLTAAQATEVIEAYESAAGASSVATEARLRLGWFLHRAGRPDEALRQFDAAPPSPNSDLEYLRELFRSHVYLSQNKIDQAIAAARAAHLIVPEAQSARVNLMNAFLLNGDSAGAATVAGNIETAPRTADPWWTYWLGDFRSLTTLVTALREISK